jgi:hypothetical protein
VRRGCTQRVRCEWTHGYGGSQPGRFRLARVRHRAPGARAPPGVDRGGRWRTFVDAGSGSDLEPQPPRLLALRVDQLLVLPLSPPGGAEDDVQPHLPGFLRRPEGVRTRSGIAYRLASPTPGPAGRWSPAASTTAHVSERFAPRRLSWWADTIPRCHLLARKSSPRASPTPGSSSSRRAATTPLPKSRRSSGRRFAVSSELRSHPTAPGLSTSRPRDDSRLRLAYFD